MREADVRELLESAAAGDAPPSAVDLGRAVRDGHRTRTTRRALLAGGAALGVSGILGATAVLRSGKPGPIVAGWEWPPPVYGAFGGPTLAAAPDSFDLFGQWAVFGWLPFRAPTVFSYVEADDVGLSARGDQVIHLALLRREQAAEELARKGVVEEAPPVAGSTARWISTRDAADQDFLQWRCAPGMWAQVTTWAAGGGPGKPTGAERRTMLHRVASGVGLSATRRQRFPFRTDAVPAGIPLRRLELTLTAEGRWEVLIRGGSLESFNISLTNVPPASRTVHTGPVGFPVPRATEATTTRSDVDGLPGAYVRSESSELVIAFRPDDITVSVGASHEALRQLGPDGALGLYRTIEVLPDPATWSDRPM